jgi:phage head maturation protease
MREESPSLLLPLEGVATLVGPFGLELVALAGALALSYRTGREVVPTWEPKGMGHVSVASYVSNWASWRGLLADVADIAGVPDPSIRIQCLSDPVGREKHSERDPDSAPFWDAAVDADLEADIEAARVMGRQFAPSLQIIVGYGMSPASGFGADMRALYDTLRPPALVVDARAAAGDFGPVFRLSDLRAQDGVSEFLERIVARYVRDGSAGDAAETEPEPTAAANGAHLRSSGADVNALLVECGIDAVRQLVTDGRSVASKRLKALARARGFGSGALYHAARRIADTEVLSGELAHRVAGRSPGVLYGYAARFNEWREVNSLLEGHFLQRFAPGCFAQTIAEVRKGRKVTFRHGKDPRFGHKLLGPITLLEEDALGLRYEVELLDADHTWELAPWLATGRYGGSLTFDVIRDTFIRNPGKSANNARGIPEQTVTEIRVQEFGPVDPPAYRGTSAGIRSSIDVHSQ